ncbi:hypothetical protein [Goodfellowiella coeruleoviolacea]|uniref:Uncharacterized protein n=1 Tax=Goodfellowiella coeruleoviolacea TaxID=334858 RepID=A0AAE3GFJ1_9PSEU|nr:hypothetical protein [Goodfellowiella coeruleoviolacea]MCP2165223.1 hypothetical protein [Goodfellowiella coeruleoviolacea]
MRSFRREAVRLWRCAVDRPRWQLALTALVSTWTLGWIGSQFGQHARSPLGVLHAAVTWAGIPGHWLESASAWFGHPGRQGLLAVLAVAGGLCWAATAERAQLPGLLGWLAVLAAAEGIGYRASVHRAALAMVVFVVVLALLSLPFRRTLVVDRIVLLPRDVVRAGVTAATLAVVVPLVVPGLVLVRLLRPYLTRPPRPDPTRRAIPLARQPDQASGPGQRKPARPAASARRSVDSGRTAN